MFLLVWFHGGACLCALDQALPLPHVAVVVLCMLWNLDLGCRSSSHYCVLALRNPTENLGYRSPRVERPVESGKVCTPSNSTRCPACVQSRCLHQWREILCIYETVRVRIAAVFNALTVFGCFRRQCIVATPRIPLDRIGHQTAWTKTDCTASRLAVGVVSRCLLRLADVESAKTESRWCPVM